jgi:hypothetical protein
MLNYGMNEVDPGGSLLMVASSQETALFQIIKAKINCIHDSKFDPIRKIQSVWIKF